MIFPKLIHEKILQVDDKTRLDASESFSTTDAIIDVLIDAGEGYISVFHQDPRRWVLDWAFDEEGQKEVKLKVITQLEDIGESIPEESKEKSYFIEVLTPEEDSLFSDDASIFSYETELKNQIPLGKNSFKYAHRNSQKEIIRYLDGEGIRDKNSLPFTKEELRENTYIREWSVYLTIMNILEDQRVSNNDIFEAKRQNYMAKLIDAKKNAVIRLDFNRDGEIEPTEFKNVQMKYLSR